MEAPRLSAFAIGVSFDLDGVEGERAGSGETPAPDSAGFRGVRPDGGSCWRRPGEPCFCGAVPAVTAEGALSMATGESRGSPAPGRRLGTGLASAAAPTKRLRFVPAVIIFISEQHAARRLSIASIETPRASAAATDACTDAMSATADMPRRRHPPVRTPQRSAQLTKRLSCTAFTVHLDTGAHATQDSHTRSAAFSGFHTTCSESG